MKSRYTRFPHEKYRNDAESGFKVVGRRRRFIALLMYNVKIPLS